jgi:hypothetical protein
VDTFITIGNCQFSGLDLQDAIKRREPAVTGEGVVVPGGLSW